MKIKGPSHPCKSHWSSSWFEKQCQNFAVLQPCQMHQDLQEQWDLLWPKQQMCVDDCHYSANTGSIESEIHFLLVERAAALWLLYETHFHLQYCWVRTSPKQKRKKNITFSMLNKFSVQWLFSYSFVIIALLGKNLFTFYTTLWILVCMRQF